MQSLHLKFPPELKDVFFDIADVRNKKTKDEFTDIIVENLDELNVI